LSPFGGSPRRGRVDSILSLAGEGVDEVDGWWTVFVILSSLGGGGRKAGGGLEF